MIFRGNYIGGHFRKSMGEAERVSEDPGDLDHPIGKFCFSSAQDVEEVVSSALEGFLRWREKNFRTRERSILLFQRALKRRRDELARLISREMGKPLRDAAQEVDRMIERIDLARSEATRISRAESFSIQKGLKGVLRYKPRGVLAIIGPFNFPGYIPNNQILSAILLGNSVVFKPSELTPFVGQLLAEVWHEADLPRGVFNLIHGDGSVGKVLAIHEKVNGIIFTGSYGTGQKIREETVHQIGKLVALEMGGKNAAIISKNSDLKTAVEECIVGSFSMAGQRCNATSRIILEKKTAKPFVEAFMASLGNLKIGYGLETETFMGPLVSQAAAEKYLSRAALAPAENFELLKEALPLQKEKRGYYVSPSVSLKEVKKEDSLKGPYAEEEIFGPNVAIYVVDSLEEAVRVHNSSPYGLVASFYSNRREEYEEVFRQLEVGLLNWNRATTFSNPRLPFGGVKRSGNHHPVGAFVPYLCMYPVAVLENLP